MGETTPAQRTRIRSWIADGAPERIDMGVYEQALGCVNDADRLAEAESLLREAREYSDIQTSDILADKIDTFLSGGG